MSPPLPSIPQSSTHGALAFFLVQALHCVWSDDWFSSHPPNDFDLCRYILGFDVAEVQVHNQRGRFFSIANSST